MIDFIRQVVTWIGSHPHWAGGVIALVAFSESLAFIGLVVPGAAMMFAAGALVAGGALHFWPIFFWAVAGAILGDGLSYWLGYHYRDQISAFRPFRRHPQLLEHGEAFFHRHGGKSVLLGRFIGPVRPVIPIVAGMLDMPPVRFYLTNIFSALGWAPAYLLPGMAFGASLALAGAVAGRLALLAALLVIAVWLMVVVMRRLYHFINARAGHWLELAAHWVRTQRWIALLLGDLLEPGPPLNRSLALWVVVLIGGGWLFLGVLEDVINLDPLVQADQAFYHLFQSVRDPSGDRLMVVLSEFGDPVVVYSVTVFVVLWLLWHRAWHDLLYWLSAVGFGTLAVAALKVMLEIPRPVPLYSGLNAFSFPSGHATMSVVVYGFAAVLAAGDLPLRWRVFPYTFAALLITGIGVSRLYLGAHWLSDVAGGLAFGSAWIALLVIARQRHHRPPLGFSFAPAVAVVLFAVGVWHINVHLVKDLRRYAIREPEQHIEQKEWRMSGWQQLPAYRIDLEGEYKQPLNIQWAGNLTGIRKLLSDHGWHAPMPLTLRNALRYLMPSPTLADMPFLPQLHNGRYESLLMIRKTNAANGNWLVLHLWSTQIRLEPGQTPMWIGTLARLDLKRLPFLAFPVTADNYDQAIATLKPNLSDACSEKHVTFRPVHEDEHTGPSHVLLLCRTSTSKSR